MKELSSIPETPQIHRAEWVVPVSAPPLRNGAVLIHKGGVIAAGPYHAVRRDSPAAARLVDHGRAALMPALVNAHTHLELSALKGKIAFPQRSFREWIALLLALRVGMEPHWIDEGLRSGETELLRSGTGLCADITNGGAVEHQTVEDWTGGRPERRIFLELLGFNLDSVAAVMPVQWPVNQTPPFIPVPHSVYSVSPAIIAESKEWTRLRGLPFSIHAAEHLDEIEFLQSGQGFCRELLERLGRWNPGWNPPGKTPVEYLDCLGVLDSRTMLVHAVHMTETDWAIAARRRCTVVFCPRSNLNLSSGSPWIEKAISLGIRCTLGTDSLASNTDLNLFAEACFTLDNHPSIDARRVLEMITVNPARSLCENHFGRIEPGAKAHLLAVNIPGVNESNLVEALIHSGKEGAWKWVNGAQS